MRVEFSKEDLDELFKDEDVIARLKTAVIEGWSVYQGFDA